MAFHFLNQELAIDLGTANTVIFQNDQIALDEPSIVAIDNQSGKCIALGQKAKLMHEKTNPGIKTSPQPVRPQPQTGGGHSFRLHGGGNPCRPRLLGARRRPGRIPHL